MAYRDELQVALLRADEAERKLQELTEEKVRRALPVPQSGDRALRWWEKPHMSTVHWRFFLKSVDMMDAGRSYALSAPVLILLFLLVLLPSIPLTFAGALVEDALRAVARYRSREVSSRR